MQNDFCHEEGVFAKQGLDVKPAQEVATRIQDFIEKARLYNIPIIYTKQIESTEVSPENLQRQFASGKLAPVCVDTFVRRAFTEGYQVVVLRDLVATMNRAAEEHYLSIFDRFFGEVIHSETVLSYLAIGSDIAQRP